MRVAEIAREEDREAMKKKEKAENNRKLITEINYMIGLVVITAKYLIRVTSSFRLLWCFGYNCGAKVKPYPMSTVRL